MEERRQKPTLHAATAMSWSTPGIMIQAKCFATPTQVISASVAFFIETDLSIPQGFTAKVELILKKEQSP